MLTNVGAHVVGAHVDLIVGEGISRAPSTLTFERSALTNALPLCQCGRFEAASCQRQGGAAVAVQQHQVTGGRRDGSSRKHRPALKRPRPW